MRRIKKPESNSEKLDRLLKTHDRLIRQQKRLERIFRETKKCASTN